MDILKLIFVILGAFIFIVILSFIIPLLINGGYGYHIQQKIYLESKSKNIYELYSCIVWNSLTNSIIEYQVYPTFKGTKEECLRQKEIELIELKEKLKEFKND